MKCIAKMPLEERKDYVKWEQADGFNKAYINLRLPAEEDSS